MSKQCRRVYNIEDLGRDPVRIIGTISERQFRADGYIQTGAQPRKLVEPFRDVLTVWKTETPTVFEKIVWIGEPVDACRDCSHPEDYHTGTAHGQGSLRGGGYWVCPTFVQDKSE